MLVDKWDLEAEIKDLKSRLEGKPPRSPSKRPDFPDFSRMSVRALQEFLDEVGADVGELQHERDQLERQILNSPAYQRRRGPPREARSPSPSGRDRPGTSSMRSVRSHASAHSTGFSRPVQPLTQQERECLKDFECLLGVESRWGLRWDRTWEEQPMGPKDETHRRNRREGTKQKVVEELELKEFGDYPWSCKDLRMPPKTDLHIFLDKSPWSKTGSAPPGGKYLLGRFDVAVVKVQADFDRNWKRIEGHRSDFWVAHAAALNIGESTEAADFEDFSIQEGSDAGRLDTKAYFKSMEIIMANVTHACVKLKIEHLVFFPFGMGAFIRHLAKLDDRYASFEELQKFRRRLSKSFVYILSKHAPEYTHIHLCVMFGSEETQCNADGLLRAFASETAEGERLRPRVTIYPEGDCLDLAQTLAEKSGSVMLLNGANRAMLGNHWFAGRAKLAIDENLHRRSWKLAATSYLLNGYDGQEPEGRHPDTLIRNATKMKGKVYVIERK